jgi:cytoskeletal protein CcmA (bactofilin family)
MALPAHSERPQGEINTLLGRGSEFEGKLTFEGTVRIDGKLSGEIFSEDVLVVGEGAMVSAEIDVGVIIVEGNVTGNIRAKRAVELHAPARVKGNIETPSLYIDKGVIFEGFSKMEGIGGAADRPRTLEGLAAAAAKATSTPAASSSSSSSSSTAATQAPPTTKK